MSFTPDLIVRSHGEIYELKPLKEGPIEEARTKIAQMLYWLSVTDDPRNPKSHTGSWKAGGEFSPTLFEYKGHTVFIAYEERGVAVYFPDCVPNCHDVDLENRPAWNTIGHLVVDIFKHVFLPSREGVPAPEPLL